MQPTWRLGWGILQVPGQLCQQERALKSEFQLRTLEPQYGKFITRYGRSVLQHSVKALHNTVYYPFSLVLWTSPTNSILPYLHLFQNRLAPQQIC